jgi:aspartate racemase
MKTIGLLGGMSWESTALYYDWINKLVNERLGEVHSGRVAMLSVDFQELEELRFQDDWDGIGRSLAEDALRVEQAGADFLLLCTNTMHMVAAQIEAAINIPLIHIADPTAEAIKARGLDTIGLLGTKFTMEEDFYVKRLENKFGLKVLIPSETDREIAHNVIYGELVKGVIKEESRQAYLRIMDDLAARGAQVVIEGCTEIVTLVQQDDTEIPLFDTTALHAKAAVDRALA